MRAEDVRGHLDSPAASPVQMRWVLLFISGLTASVLASCASPSAERTRSSEYSATQIQTTPVTDDGTTVVPTLASLENMGTPRPTTRSAPTAIQTVMPSHDVAFWTEAIRTNLGCDLPCWWGLQPGEATWAEVSNLFAAVGSKPFSFPSSQVLTRHDFYINPAESVAPPIAFATWDRDGVIWGFEVSVAQLHSPSGMSFPAIASAYQRYSLQELLPSWGTPTTVLIDAQPFPAEADAPMIYSIWIDWAEAGIVAYYEGEGPDRVGDMLSLCPDYSRLSHSRLYLWSPQERPSLAEITSATGDIPAQIATGRLRPVQDATGLQISDFARLFAAAPDGTCVHIKPKP
jgi:hypothetical protein